MCKSAYRNSLPQAPAMNDSKGLEVFVHLFFQLSDFTALRQASSTLRSNPSLQNYDFSLKLMLIDYLTLT